MKTRSLITAAAGAVFLLSAAGSAFAQGAPQTLASLDVKAVATGYRSSKIVGSAVRNDADQRIGKINDVIIGRNDRALVAVVSVGGFLGVGNKLVAVPYDQLRPTPDNKGFVLAGASKDALKSLPAFSYAK
ncbi:MAG: PRC-barrel domain protein [Rhodospirillales bacterium]|jgi:hypothetical protein|nr:PRC-barrel domain protein [Rhodospirillales bacterium]